MSRTVDSTLDLPEQRSHPHIEIADSLRGTGWQELATAVNTLYEHHRGTWVADYSTTGLLNGTGTTSYYRIRQWGGNSTILCRVYAYVVTGGAGNCVVRAVAGGGSTSSSATGASFTGWVNVGTVAMDCTSEYDTLEIDLTTASNASMLGVAAYPGRGLTAHTDAPDDWAYDDGFTPVEITEYGGERSLSATKARILHEGLRLLWEQRVPQVIASDYAISPLADVAMRCEIPLPKHLRPGASATLRCEIRARWTGSSVGLDLGAIAVSAGGSTGIVSVSSGGTVVWFERDLTIDIPGDADVEQTTTTLQVGVSGDVELCGLCAWWRDLTYG